MNMFKETSAKTPEEYIAGLDGSRRGEIQKLHDFIRSVAPDLKPHIQSGMIGYGTYHYKYASGREGDWMIIALASQKNYISVYVCAPDGDQYVPEKYKDQLPKANIGKSCIRFKRTEDIDLDVLATIIRKGAGIES